MILPCQASKSEESLAHISSSQAGNDIHYCEVKNQIHLFRAVETGMTCTAMAVQVFKSNF